MEFIFTCNSLIPYSSYDYHEDTGWSKKKKNPKPQPLACFLKTTFLSTLLKAVSRQRNEKFSIP